MLGSFTLLTEALTDASMNELSTHAPCDNGDTPFFDLRRESLVLGKAPSNEDMCSLAPTPTFIY